MEAQHFRPHVDASTTPGGHLQSNAASDRAEAARDAVRSRRIQQILDRTRRRMEAMPENPRGEHLGP